MARKRLNQFAFPHNSVHGSFYQDLLTSAIALLQLALLDRRSFAKNDKTHGSRHAPGAIVLAMTGFDIWLTEIITGLIRPVEEARDLLDSPTTSKYKTLYERFHGQLPGELSELETVVDIRHEIVHHFPRLNRSLIPEWFPELQRRGLLLTSPSGNDDFDFTQKLGSYSLSYWVFQVVESSAGRLVCGSKIGTAKLHTSDLYNFALYKAVCHPEQLQLFDAQDSLDREIRQ